MPIPKAEKSKSELAHVHVSLLGTGAHTHVTTAQSCQGQIVFALKTIPAVCEQIQNKSFTSVNSLC